MKRFFLLVFVVLAVGFLAVKFFPKKENNSFWPVKKMQPSVFPTPQQFSFEESQKIAQEAVKNSPTYKFDGFDLKFENSETLRCPSCWEFTFSFKSRGAGYGDRTGKMVAQVITPHTTRVTVDNGKITSIVTDQTFDEINQKFLK